MSKKTKKIVILSEVELRKTISRLTYEIIEKVKKLDNLLLVGIPTRGIELTEVFENGLPKLSEVQKEEEVIKWDKKPLKIVLKNTSIIGEDNLKLFFKITKSADLFVKCFDIKDEFLGEYNLGNIF